MTLVEGLKVLRRDAMDWDSQRCRMGPALMSGLGLRLGAPVLIRVQRGVCLCTAWPRRDLAEGFLQISTQCATPDLSAQTLTGLMVKPAHITPLTCPRLSSVSVKVFVQRLEHKRKVSEPSVHKLLEGLYVHQGHLVDLSGAETEIRCVLVEKVNSGSQKAGLITARTHVEVSLAQTVKHLERRQEVSAASPGGLEEVYTSLKEMITFPLRYPETLRQLGVSCPRGLLLIGPPGVGKTLLVRCVARDIGATLVTVNGPEVTGSRPGESEENLRRVFDQVQEATAGPCVLLIDEIDSLCPRRSESSGAPENRLVAQLLTLMDGISNHEGFCWVTSLPLVRSLTEHIGQFLNSVIVGAPSLLQRRSILKSVCREMPLSSEVDLNAVAEMTCGYVGADLSALSREAALQAMRQSQAGASELVSMQHFMQALRIVQPSCLRSSIGATDFKPVSWEQIGGLDDVKLKLKQVLNILATRA
uniref:Spermatogenesis associated 5-like 1 n=1 Tax=Sinocyclocheilus anshuiensis TaxID=1608454 RepID=A0A671NJ57_9TELE